MSIARNSLRKQQKNQERCGKGLNLCKHILNTHNRYLAALFIEVEFHKGLSMTQRLFARAKDPSELNVSYVI